MSRTVFAVSLLAVVAGSSRGALADAPSRDSGPTGELRTSLVELPSESGLRLAPPRTLELPSLPSPYLARGPATDGALTEDPASSTALAESAQPHRTAAHFGASFGGVLLGAVATGVVVGTVHAFENDGGRARDLTLAIGGPLLLTAGATWALHRLATARGEEVRHLPVVVGALLSAGAALAGVFVASNARDEAFVGRHWAWAAPAVALSTGFGAWVAHRLTHGPRRVQPSLGVSPTGVAAHLRVGFRR